MRAAGRTAPIQGDFLEEVALALGPAGWTELQQIYVEGIGQSGQQKAWIKSKTVQLHMLAQGSHFE